jgi:hypothetical protein
MDGDLNMNLVHNLLETNNHADDLIDSTKNETSIGNCKQQAFFCDIVEVRKTNLQRTSIKTKIEHIIKFHFQRSM